MCVNQETVLLKYRLLLNLFTSTIILFSIFLALFLFILLQDGVLFTWGGMKSGCSSLCQMGTKDSYKELP